MKKTEKSKKKDFFMKILLFPGFRIRLFNLFIKVLSCILYCLRVASDNGELPKHVPEKIYAPGQIK